MPIFREIPAEQTGHVPVKIWTDQIEESALAQLKALAGCPFLVHHVAEMPDVHYGLGATIGSVFATTDVLLPTAVGVDIGCFTGDTLIPLLDGSECSLKELAELPGEFWVWAITPTQRITAAPATAKKTRLNAALMNVMLDNGQIITCTPDHQFMLRNGEWQEARDLTSGSSLMPLYKKLDRAGDMIVYQPYSDEWERMPSLPSVPPDEGYHDHYSYIRDREAIRGRQGALPHTILNHTVVSVKALDYCEDVYCLTV